MIQFGTQLYRNELPRRIFSAIALFDQLFGGLCVAILHSVDVDCEHAVEVFFGKIQ